MAEHQVIIIGGGVSGLAAAYYLRQQGIRSTLLEQSDRLGGLIRTDRVHGCDLEAGPDSFIANKAAVPELAAELGLTGQLIDSNDAARRVFVGRNAKLVPMPPGMVMMAPAELGTAFRSSFFSLATKFRFARELRAKPYDRPGDVSFGDFVRDHFGSEVLETIGEPLLTGVYGGDPAGLSLRSVLPRFLDYEREYGSVIRGVQNERRQRKPGASLFRSFQGGMQTLTDALAAAIRDSTTVRCGEALSVARVAGDRWSVATGSETLEADAVIVAVPAHAGARILAQADASLASLLGQISYSSAILVTQGFDRATLGHPLDGFGFLIPRGERRTIAAATWISTKFPSRTPGPVAAIRSFIVGEQAVQLQTAPDAAILEQVGQELRRWMNLKNEPKFSLVSRWPQSMPQYTVGHSERVAQINRQVAALSGLYLCGNAYDGVGIPDSVRMAKTAAHEAAQTVSRNPLQKQSVKS